jgi:hypothetical protein
MKIADGYPDAVPEVRAALIAAEEELGTFDIPPVTLGGGMKGIAANMAARAAWRAAHPERSKAFDALCARIDRLEGEAQAPSAAVVAREHVRCRVPEAVLVAVRSADMTREAIAGAREWITTPRTERKSALMLTGVTGTGKTVAAAWIATRFALFRRWWQGQPSGTPTHTPLVWLHGPTVTQVAGFLPDDVEARVEAAVGAELLIVDELEVTGGKSGLLAMASLITRRYDSGRFTVITTNAGREQLAEGLGQHVADRLGSSCVVAIKGKASMRSKKP